MSLPSIVPYLLGADATGDAGGGFWLPPQASTIADIVDPMFFAIYWICVFFFVGIVGVMVYFCWRFRRKPGVRAEKTPTHHTALELTWTIIPLIIVIAIFYEGLEGYAQIVQAPANAYEVDVTAMKWVWNFEHRNGASSDSVLKVPAGRPVKLTMTSTDVLHALFIPAFRVKQDLVPGRYTYIWFQADEPGIHQIFCAEYCGTQHSQMTAMVEVLPPEEFERVIAEDAVWIDAYDEENLQFAGPRLYARCKSCHTLDGSKLIGPSFRETHSLWGKKRPYSGGEVTVDDNYIQESILNPAGKVVTGFAALMPSMKGQLKPKEIRALIRFIQHLDEAVDENWKLLPDSELKAKAGIGS